jgi:hypothetical protein
MAKQKLHANQEANYEFYKMHEPAIPMGSGSFANLPDQPILKMFSRKHQHRDGITNSFSVDLDDMSGIEENVI